MRQALFLTSRIVNEVDLLKHNYHAGWSSLGEIRRALSTNRRDCAAPVSKQRVCVVSTFRFVGQTNQEFLLKKLLVRLTLKEETLLEIWLPMATGTTADATFRMHCLNHPVIFRMSNMYNKLLQQRDNNMKSAPLSIPEPPILTPKRATTALFPLSIFNK